MHRTLVAGFGNILRGDDGFGVEMIRRLHEAPPRPHVVLLDVGTGGMLLVQELMSQYDRLLIIDAIDRRASPGSVFLLSIDGVRDAERVDTHFAVPAAALSVARALNVLPAEVKMLGCQPDPQSMEDLSTELSPAVKGAIGKALEMINSLLDESSSQSVERAYAHDGNAAGEGRHLADLPQHQPHESLSAPAPIERRETPEA